MKTRRNYLDNLCSYREYYAQFVTPYIKQLVAAQINPRTYQQDDDFVCPFCPLVTNLASAFIVHLDEHAKKRKE